MTGQIIDLDIFSVQTEKRYSSSNLCPENREKVRKLKQLYN